MKEYVFNYYKDFSCIKEKCNHTCCEKWTVSIDKRSLKKYKHNKSPLSDRLKKSIDYNNKTFIMTSDNRCPFLNKDNLCDLIIGCGENSLCQVCADHPRFRTFFSGRIEMGLGLTCEEACRIILESKDKMSLISVDNKNEKLSKLDRAILSFREEILSYLQDRNIPVIERVNVLLSKYHLVVTDNGINDFLAFIKGLENLDEKWCEQLDGIKELKYPSIDDETAFEQLVCYFVYRHVNTDFNGFAKEIGLIFSVLSAMVITSIANALNIGLKEVSRAYSSEIEYSQNNLEKVFDYLDRSRRLNRI